MPEASPINESQPKGELVPAKKKQYVPSEEKPEFKAMYSYYQGLGKQRSLHKVAKEFGKSVQFIATLSRTFKWQARLKALIPTIQDPVVTVTKAKVDSTRKKLVDVVEEVTDILHAMALLANAVKQKETPSPEDTRRIATLITALSVFGFRLEKPKDLRDLVGVLKEIVDFNVNGASTVPAPTGDQNTQINVEELNLTITGLE